MLQWKCTFTIGYLEWEKGKNRNNYQTATVCQEWGQDPSLHLQTSLLSFILISILSRLWLPEHITLLRLHDFYQSLSLPFLHLTGWPFFNTGLSSSFTLTCLWALEHLITSTEIFLALHNVLFNVPISNWITCDLVGGRF